MRPDNRRRPRVWRGLLAHFGTAPLWVLGCLLVTAGCQGESPPTPLAFVPTSGAVGTVVTITGSDLSTTRSVTIGGVAAIALSQSASVVTALVMPGATSGPVQVTTATGVVTPAGTFTVTATDVPTTQQGPKLVGTDVVDNAGQGGSVALSADGNTAVVGGFGDSGNVGAAWVYTR